MLGNYKSAHAGAAETFETILEVFPNPAADVVNVQLISKDLSGGILTIRDCLGVTRFERLIEEPGGTFVLPVYGLSAGTYIVQYENSGKTFVSKLIVLK